MPITCQNGETPRYRYRDIKGGKQRLAFCNNKVMEITTFKNTKINKPKGWRQESARHALASKGIKTGRKQSFLKKYEPEARIILIGGGTAVGMTAGLAGAIGTYLATGVPLLPYFVGGGAVGGAVIGSQAYKKLYEAKPKTSKESYETIKEAYEAQKPLWKKGNVTKIIKKKGKYKILYEKMTKKEKELLIKSLKRGK